MDNAVVQRLYNGTRRRFSSLLDGYVGSAYLTIVQMGRYVVVIETERTTEMNAKLTPEDILKPKHAATYRNSVVRADKFEQMMYARIARKHPNWDDSDIWTEIFEMRSDVEFAARKEEGRA